MKHVKFLAFMLAMIAGMSLFISCGSDDDEDEPSGSTTNSLVGTTWEGSTGITNGSYRVLQSLKFEFTSPTYCKLSLYGKLIGKGWNSWDWGYVYEYYNYERKGDSITFTNVSTDVSESEATFTGTFIGNVMTVHYTGPGAPSETVDCVKVN